jgi:hypothetical protein
MKIQIEIVENPLAQAEIKLNNTVDYLVEKNKELEINLGIMDLLNSKAWEDWK